MFDQKYWRTHFPLAVAAHGGEKACVARVLTYYDRPGAGDYLLKGVVKTEEGYGIFEVYLNAQGKSPIQASTSSTHDFSLDTIVSSKTVSLPYENIADVQIV